MQDFEKLGLFYLGRRYDLDARQVPRRAGPLRLARPGDARRVRRHDGQRQDRALPVADRGGGHRRRAGHRHRSQGRSRQPAADVSRLAAKDFRPWIDEDEARRAGQDARRVCRAAGGDAGAQGLAEWGQDGARIERLREAAEFAIYTPGSRAGLPVSILSSFAAPPAAARDDAELLAERAGNTATSLLSLAGVDAAAAQPRAHAAHDRASTACMDGGRDLDLAVADPAGPDAAVSARSASSISSRSSRRRSASTSRCGSTPCSPRPGSSSGSRASRSIRRRCSTRRREAARRRSSRSRTSATRSGCSSSRCCCNQIVGVDAHADRHVEPARHPLHGRDRRLLPAGREPAVASCRC